MARIVSTIVLIALLSTLVGCGGSSYDSAQLMEIDDRRPINTAPPAGTSEADLVEEMAISRESYQKGLELMIGYYNQTGNNTMLARARRELDSFKLMTKYNYISEPIMLLGVLKATTPIPAADDLYYDGKDFEDKAGPISGFRNQNKLRLAKQKYNQLLKDYPTSDKVDDAAYRAGAIMEEFKEYVVALEYYKSAYRSDPETIYPARFRAARIMDKQLHQYADALMLYKEAVAVEARFDKYRQWKNYAEDRIRDIEKL